MELFKFTKTALLSVGIAFGASATTAATVASFEITDGAVNIGAGPATGGGLIPTEVLQITGDFSSFIDLGFDPDSEGNYTLAADLTLDGNEIFNEDITLFTTGTDLLLDAIDIASTIDAIVPGLLGNVLNEALDGDLAQTEISSDLWFGIDFDLTDADFGDGTLAGSFTAILSEAELAFPSNLAFFTPAVDFSGSASVSFDGNVNVVPLPASAPLLLAGLVGMVFLRRRNRA